MKTALIVAAALIVLLAAGLVYVLAKITRWK